MLQTPSNQQEFTGYIADRTIELRKSMRAISELLTEELDVTVQADRDLIWYSGHIGIKIQRIEHVELGDRYRRIVETTEAIKDFRKRLMERAFIHNKTALAHELEAVIIVE